MIADDSRQWLAHQLNTHPITCWWLISLAYISAVVGGSA